MKHIDYFSPSIGDPVGDFERWDYYRTMDAQNETDETEDRRPWEVEEKFEETCGKY